MGAGASGQTYRKELPEVLKLTAEVLREPSFPANELEQLKRARATQLEASRTDPQAIASRAIARHANPYPAGDPRYAPTVEESLASNNAVTLDDVKALPPRLLRRVERRARRSWAISTWRRRARS